MRKVRAVPEEPLEAPVGVDSYEPGVSVQEELERPSGEATEPQTVFPKESMEALSGLLYLGRIETTFEHAGHEFRVRTLTQGERIEMLQMAGRYKGTPAEADAVRALTVAAALVEVDGQPLYRALGPSDEERALGERFRTVLKWYPGVVRAVYRAVQAVEKTADDALALVKKR